MGRNQGVKDRCWRVKEQGVGRNEGGIEGD